MCGHTHTHTHTCAYIYIFKLMLLAYQTVYAIHLPELIQDLIIFKNSYIIVINFLQYYGYINRKYLFLNINFTRFLYL